ncbi:MAG: hypothetical protein WC794_05485 [Candidatus Doudnabacteria bacterium]|jgi:hypothetical protein
MAENEEGSAIELVVDFAHKLSLLDPNHELLRFIHSESSPELDEEFNKRFWNKPFPVEGQPGSLVNTTMLAAYAVALSDAVASLTKVETPPEGGTN